MLVYRGVIIVHWRGQLSKHKLAAWFPNLNDLRVWDLVPDSPCPADHGSGNDRGQDEETLCSRFHRWCSCSREALRCARVKKAGEENYEKKSFRASPHSCVYGAEPRRTVEWERTRVSHLAPLLYCSPHCSPPCSPALGAQPCSCLSPGLPPAGHLGVGRRRVQDNPGYLLDVFFEKPFGNPLNQSPSRGWQLPFASPKSAG